MSEIIKSTTTIAADVNQAVRNLEESAVICDDIENKLDRNLKKYDQADDKLNKIAEETKKGQSTFRLLFCGCFKNEKDKNSSKIENNVVGSLEENPTQKGPIDKKHEPTSQINFDKSPTNPSDTLASNLDSIDRALFTIRGANENIRNSIKKSDKNVSLLDQKVKYGSRKIVDVQNEVNKF